MSLLPEQHSALLPERHTDQDEELLFAAASIIRQMARSGSDPAVREVSINQRSYRLEGRRLQTSTEATGPIVLVFVEPKPAVMPSEDVLREQFRFTRKEAKVAMLIAAGLPNEDVAVELSISPHTARHHTERVLAKLGLRSRTHVKAALLNW
jgi:DNA-binding CsgD family transcriptional regulator